MEPIDNLHAELYDYIVDFLHNDDEALRACALVCRAWVPVTRFHLFYHIKLSGCGPSPTSSGWARNTACRRIFNSILTFPHLASYVNSLSIEEPNVVRPATFRWVCEEITFPTLLTRFSNLQTLEFKFPAPCQNDVKTGWSTMAFRDIQEAISTMTLHSFSLRQFFFASVLDFVKILDSCRSLKELHLDHVDINTAETHFQSSALEHVFKYSSPPNSSQTSVKKAKLETLSLHSNSLAFIIPVLLHTNSFLDLSGLLTLAINITPDSYIFVLDVLKLMPSLQQLDIDIHPDFDYEMHLNHQDTLDLTYFPSLQSLSLRTHVLLGRFEPFSWLHAMFSTAGPINKLSDLSFTCVVDKPLPSTTLEHFNNLLVHWQELDDLLSQTRFDNMQRCRFHFSLDAPIANKSVLQVHEDLNMRLQKLRDKGILQVDYRGLESSTY